MFEKCYPSRGDGGEGAGVIQILTFADRGEGVKNGLKYADVIIA